MLIKDILKLSRIKKEYTQEDVAKQLFVSTQAVSKWETGRSIPSIDNLLALLDLYEVSLDELVQGSPFFKKPYVVGKIFNWKKGTSFTLIWLFISLLFTGFGYQPFWLFCLVFLIGIFIVFAATVDDYWIIENDCLKIKKYSNKNIEKLIQIFTSNHKRKTLHYSEINKISIIYIPKVRFSPFDFGFDAFYLKVESTQGTFILNFDESPENFLPQFANFLERQKIKIIDKDNIIQLLIEGEPLFERLNKHSI